jgi:hypothetical protein
MSRERVNPAEREPPGASRPAAGRPHHLLALQRAIGNRAVGAMLMRDQIEGPWNLKDPVHEVLTLRVIKEALDRIAAEGWTAGGLLGGVDATGIPELSSKKGHNLAPEKHINKSLQQFIRGVVWPDDPRGLLFDEPAGTTDYSTGIAWYREFTPKKVTDSKALTARSHFGDLQFLHGMATQDGELAYMTAEKMRAWARFLADVSTGQIDPDDKVDAHQTPSLLFPAHRDITIKTLFGHETATDAETRQRAAGALMHLIQDSHAQGHVDRDPKTGHVREFHAYGTQDHDKHTAADKWAEGKDLGERIKNTPGAEAAIQKCKEVLVMLDQGKPTNEVIAYLDRTVLALDPAARAAGPGADFEKVKK